MNQHFIVTGTPGIGKTTVIRRVLEHLSKHPNWDKAVSGFVTEEVLGPKGREGFDVVSLGDKRAPLARTNSAFDQKTFPQSSRTPSPRVGKYFVDVASFESVALPELVIQPGIRLMIIDEIGKMEFYSEAFIESVQKVFQSHCIVLGVVPYFKDTRVDPQTPPLQVQGRNIVKEICDRSDVRLMHVTRNNREGLVRDIRRHLYPILDMVPEAFPS